MIDGIATAIGIVKDVTELLGSASKVKGTKREMELLNLVMEAQTKLIDLRSDMDEIKKQIDISNRIIRHSDGLFVTLKDDPEQIRYCSTCWGERERLVQVGDRMCPACKTLVDAYTKDYVKVKQKNNQKISFI